MSLGSELEEVKGSINDNIHLFVSRLLKPPI